MFARLIMLVAMLVQVSATAGSWTDAARDGRGSVDVANIMTAVDGDAQATDRIEPLRVGLASSPRCVLSLRRAGDVLHRFDGAPAPGAQCALHTSGCPPPRA